MPLIVVKQQSNMAVSAEKVFEEVKEENVPRFYTQCMTIPGKPKGGIASNYYLTTDRKSFVKCFHSDKHYLYLKEKMGVNHILNAGKINRIPNCIHLPTKFIKSGSSHYILYPTQSSVVDLIDYIQTNKIDLVLLKKILSAFITCFEWLQENGLSHRDFKADNCLIWKKGEEYTVKIIDFGFLQPIENKELCYTHLMMPYELQLFNRNYYGCNPNNLKKLLIKLWESVPMKRYNEPGWKEIVDLIDSTNFRQNTKYCIELIRESVYHKLFPIQPGKYQDMYNIMTMFRQLLASKDEIFESSDEITNIFNVMFDICNKSDRDTIHYETLGRLFELYLPRLKELINI